MAYEEHVWLPLDDLGTQESLLQQSPSKIQRYLDLWYNRRKMSDTTPARGAGSAASPSNSPRLPSPPPLPELQLGPRSPSITASATELSLDSVSQPDDGADRRIRPGTRAADMARGPPFVPLHQLESPFQLQEYLKSHYCKLTRDETANTVRPLSRETAMQLATPPTQQDTKESVDRNLWLYELCRFLVQRSNRLIVSFFNDSPPCSSQTCPEMRASEWQYLCAVHEPPKSCCAIDYCCHTLDWAANVLTSTKHFPSRLSLGGEGVSPYQSMRQLTNIFRRVYRIYAHAWFQHREMFWALEQEEGLYKFFKTVCDAYNLIPEDNYTIPPEAEGERDDEIEEPVPSQAANISILRSEPQEPAEEPEPETALPTSAATTRRHRHTPSTGTHVTMIAEGAEEEEGEGDATQIVQQVEPDSHATLTDQTKRSPPKNNLKDTQLPPSIPRLEMPSRSEPRAPEDPTPTPEQYTSDPFNSGPEASVTEIASVVDTDTAPLTKVTTEIKEITPLSDDDDDSKPGDVIETAPATVTSVVSGEEKDTKEGSDDEEMGEIKLTDKPAGSDPVKTEEEKTSEEAIADAVT